ncbi:MAG: DEAD/DEAH box helicase [Candidatus Diapherotrites archaeon]|nr:DEAD/DEAH box helicase [Candidatus Diapherotrites archaeon]
MPFVSHPLVKPDTIEARLYQEVLVSCIVEKGNTLVVAPTALGKTVVAVMLATHILKETPNSKILFLAPTKPLVVQHDKSFKKFLQIGSEKICAITGMVKPGEREKIYKEASIISATPQTIENDLLNGNLSLEDFGLVIFDEAHRAVGDYAYVFINLQLQKQNPRALVLALTASPGSEEEKIQDVCRNLSIKNIEIKNPEDFDVKEYVNEIEIDWIKVDLPAEFVEIKQLLENFMKKQLVLLKKLGVAKTENKRYYNRSRILEMQHQIRQRLMRHGKTQPSLYSAASACAALLKVAHAEELIETQGISTLKSYFEKMGEEARRGQSKAAKHIMADEGILTAIKITNKLFEQKIQHPKYKELKRIVLEQFEKKPNSKIIVFNHYRDSIKEVTGFLNAEEKIKATKFIGQATKGREKGMSQKEQQEILVALKEGKHNVLVASSVAEEGLDIPDVEMVIFFEPVPSEIRTIQRRGRTGRFGKGKMVVLMARNTRDEAFYWAARGKEKRMKQTLKGMSTKMIGNAAEETKNILEQTTLDSFMEKSDKIIIFADSREGASTVIRELVGKEVAVRTKQLEVGDYVLSREVCVERKTVEDFINSMIDGRLFSQLIALRNSYEKPLLIVEGNMQELFTLRNIHRNAIIGALTSIALDYQVPIINTRDAKETAEFVYVIAKREQLGRDKEIGIRFGRKGLTVEEQQRFIVEGIPMVGPMLAKNLLKEFGSIKKIANAGEKELQKVENLGEKKAKQIFRVINEKFMEK